MSSSIKVPKKLIEVALPLDDINVASVREKSIRHGHPSTLHLWWARRPLAAARAVIFAQMVNDPGGQRGYYAGRTKKQADQEREKLFDIIRDLVKWENTNNETVLSRAREVIWQSWRETCDLNKGKPGFDREKLPAFHDPFAGGGAIPLEAQRLGLESHASDLNPVAVIINKAMIEIPSKFSGRAPSGPIPSHEKQASLHDDWPSAKGLAEDVRRYGHWMREEAFKRIGHYYPEIEITDDMAKERYDLKGLIGKKLTVIAWLWTRTLSCPNPACGCETPLLSSFILSSKKGNEAYLIPSYTNGKLRFDVTLTNPTHLGELKNGFKRGMSGIFECINCGTVTSRDYTAEQAITKSLRSVQTAVICEGKNGRIYLPARYSPIPENMPTPDTHGLNVELSPNPRDVWCRNFGLKTPANLFSHRQLVALTTFSDLVQEARAKTLEDAVVSGMPNDGQGLDQGGLAGTAYAEAVSVYLAIISDKVADYWSSVCSWHSSKELIRNTFGRQALPMVWDFAEANPFCSSSGNWIAMVDWTCKALAHVPGNKFGIARQADAATQLISREKVVSTDPPYYDNIGYADLSDFFYVWMRRSLKQIYPDLFGTLSVPKAEELVAMPYRHGSKEKAEQFFMDGMTRAIHNLAEQAHPAFPVTIYYAFKQSETKDTGTSSTGWETFLEAVIRAGFAITGTWPMRTEMGTRMVSSGTNALASSIVLVCQKRDQDAETISRRQFQKELREHMPEALETMIGGVEGSTPIAPVDLAQAAIGPGMGIFSQYQAVLNQDGSPMSVHDALILINREITDYLSPDSGNFDNDTLFCSSWFDQYSWNAGPFGEADTLSRAKGTTVNGVRNAGVIESGGGKVKLLKWDNYPDGWDPQTDERMPVWEALHHMIRALNTKGEVDAGSLLARMPEKGEHIRQLAYHLYTLCERKKWTEEARAYNELITSWHGIVSSSHDVGHRGTQNDLFE